MKVAAFGALAQMLSCFAGGAAVLGAPAWLWVAICCFGGVSLALALRAAETRGLSDMSAKISSLNAELVRMYAEMPHG